MLGVDRNNHQSGLLGAPRILARLKVPGCENWGRFVFDDRLPDIWDEFRFILCEEPEW